MVEFGKRRRPAPEQPVGEAPKRSRHVALLVMGTLAVGGGAYALMPAESCPPASPGMAAPAPGCTSRGGGFGRSVHFSFFGDSSRPAPAGSSDTASGRVTRGGFGSFAAAFGFSGRG
jgi:hypothetical protein